jgi:hypothetical protein
MPPQLASSRSPCSCQVLAGGKLPQSGGGGQFYPPTVVTDVTPDMRIWEEEVFGPVMAGGYPSHAGLPCAAPQCSR